MAAKTTSSNWFRAKAKAAHSAVVDLALAGDTVGHVVVFTSTPGTAEALAECLNTELQKSHPGLFEVLELGAEADEREVRDVSLELHGESSEAIRVVCAAPQVEEGVNLQGAHRVVHFDIPRNLPSLEQRIGRVDRIGQSRTLRQVILLPSCESSAASHFIQEVLNAFGVMSESISGVQGSSEHHLQLLDQVHMGESFDLAEARSRIRRELDEERRARARERDLDAAAVADWRTGVDVDGLVEHESAVSEIERSASSPLRKFLGLVHDRRGPVGSYMRKTQQSRKLGHADEKRLGRLIGNMVLEVPGTFDRRSAVRDPGLALRRVGDPLVDWTESFFKRSGRGSAYALIRQTHPALWAAGQKRAGWSDHSSCWVFSFEVAPGASSDHDRDQVRVRRFMPPREAVAIFREEDPVRKVEVFWADEGILTESLDGAPPLAWFNLRQYPYMDAKVTPKEIPLTDSAVVTATQDMLNRFISLYEWDVRVRDRAVHALQCLEASDFLSNWTNGAMRRFDEVSREHERILRMRPRGGPELEVEARRRVFSALTNPVLSLRSAGFVVLTGGA